LSGEPVPALNADGESNWPAWPRGRVHDRWAATPLGRVLMVVVAAIGIWLLVRLV